MVAVLLMRARAHDCVARCVCARMAASACAGGRKASTEVRELKMVCALYDQCNSTSGPSEVVCSAALQWNKYLYFFCFIDTQHYFHQSSDIVTNVRKEADIINPSSGLFLELDVWIPSLKICFEFQVC